MRSLNLLALLSAFLTPVCLLAQVSEDSLIHRLEDRERIAILKGDTIALSKLISKKIVVHNPENTVVGLGQIMERIRIGKISYSSFERSIDTIAFINEIAGGVIINQCVQITSPFYGIKINFHHWFGIEPLFW